MVSEQHHAPGGLCVCQLEVLVSEVRVLLVFVLFVAAVLTYVLQTLFKSVDADKMEEAAKRLHKSLRSNTSKKIRDSDAFRGVDQDIKNFLNTCPLIMALTHKCMRPRHWEMLMKATGVEFTPPHKDKVGLSVGCRCPLFGLAVVQQVAFACALPHRATIPLPYPVTRP